MDPAVLPERLIRLVSAAFGLHIVLQPLGGQTQAVRPTGQLAGDQPPLLLKLAACLAQPPLPTLRPRDDPLDVEPLQPILSGRLTARVLAIAGRGRLACQVALKPLTTPHFGLKLDREFVTARVPCSSSSASSVAIASAMISRAIRS